MTVTFFAVKLAAEYLIGGCSRVDQTSTESGLRSLRSFVVMSHNSAQRLREAESRSVRWTRPPWSMCLSCGCFSPRRSASWIVSSRRPWRIGSVMDLASRRVHIIGSTPSPNDLFMRQVGRTLTAEDEGVLVGHLALIGDRDAKWSAPVRARLREAGIRRRADTISGAHCE